MRLNYIILNFSMLKPNCESYEFNILEQTEGSNYYLKKWEAWYLFFFYKRRKILRSTGFEKFGISAHLV